MELRKINFSVYHAGISRVYVGVHHQLDIVESILISVAVIAIAYFTTAYFRRRNAE